jgi:5-methylcytosine-specific restriction endonuclease McrA
MKLNLLFEPLKALARKMKAPDVLWNPETKSGRTFQSPLIEMEIGMSELLSLERKGPKGLFTRNGQTVVLYIKACSLSQEEILLHPEKGPKYHLLDCKTIKEMTAANRLERYVISNTRKGLFKVACPGATKEIDISLKVCKNCLSLLFPSLSRQKRNELAQTFDLAAFLNNSDTSFARLPQRRETTPVDPDYTANWQALSLRHREASGWRCSSCGVDLSPPWLRHLLHVHHKNGNRSDNSPQNLEPLCIVCHSQTPYHGHVKVPAQARREIESRRRSGRWAGEDELH